MTERILSNEEVAFLIGDKWDFNYMTRGQKRPVKTMKSKIKVIDRDHKMVPFSDDPDENYSHVRVVFKDLQSDDIFLVYIVHSEQSGWKYGWEHKARLIK